MIPFDDVINYIQIALYFESTQAMGFNPRLARPVYIHDVNMFQTC